MAKLSAKQRAKLPPKTFGLPEKARSKKARKESGNYPMPDKGHAISAIPASGHVRLLALALAPKHALASRAVESEARRLATEAPPVTARVHRHKDRASPHRPL